MGHILSMEMFYSMHEWFLGYASINFYASKEGLNRKNNYKTKQ